MFYDYILWIINCNSQFCIHLYSCSSLTLHPIVRYFPSRHTKCWIGFFHSHPPYSQQPSKSWIMLTAITNSYMKDFTFIMPKAQLCQKWYFSIDSVYELSTVDFVLKSMNNISIKDSKVSV